ncbi:MAG: hypothetical protein RI894_1183 [Bacteroidota bacterium]|jgi:hypothetical protein
MKKPTFFFFSIALFFSTFTTAQTPENSLPNLEKRLGQGDKTAFIDLASPLDDHSVYVEKVAMNNNDFKTTVRAVAQRILTENTLFFKIELRIDTSLSQKDFKAFLTENDAQLKFDKRAEIWLITPLEKRPIDYTLRKVTDATLEKIATRHLFNKTWVVESGIDKLIAAHSTEALWQIAAHLFRTRTRFNRPDFTTSEHTDLLRLLTNCEVGVMGDVNGKKNVISYDADNDYGAKTQLNMLIYYLTHHKDYEWDAEMGAFKNTKETPKPADRLAELYGKIKSHDEPLAIGAFVALAEMPTDMVEKLFKENKTNYTNQWNSALPHEDFGVRILLQLTNLTAYCRERQIDYKGSGNFHKYWAKLRSAKDFKTRYAAENDILKTFTYKDITALEFWGIVYQNDYKNTFSVGRIVDKWYSKHWADVTENEENLCLYLKKAAIFKEFGIVGNCNNYLRKFGNMSPEAQQAILTTAQKSKDSDVQQEAEIIPTLPPILDSPTTPKTCPECTPYAFDDLLKNADVTAFYDMSNKLNNNHLNYNELYDVLRYDITDAFISGGGSKRSEGVENAIKLLEATFKTTLGFEQKYYKQNYWYYDCAERAAEWQQYLQDKKLVEIDKNEPESLSIR